MVAPSLAGGGASSSVFGTVSGQGVGASAEATGAAGSSKASAGAAAGGAGERFGLPPGLSAYEPEEADELLSLQVGAGSGWGGVGSVWGGGCGVCRRCRARSADVGGWGGGGGASSSWDAGATRLLSGAGSAHPRPPLHRPPAGAGWHQAHSCYPPTPPHPPAAPLACAPPWPHPFRSPLQASWNASLHVRHDQFHAFLSPVEDGGDAMDATFRLGRGCHHGGKAGAGAAAAAGAHGRWVLAARCGTALRRSAPIAACARAQRRRSTRALCP